jgi:hypothetical protein
LNTPTPFGLNTLADRQIGEDERPRCIVRVSTHAWRDKKSLHYEKRISFLRRLSKLHEILDHDADMIGADEVIGKITNLNKVEDGIYEVITTNESRDWETGTLDDYDYCLVRFDPKRGLSADVAASTLSRENKKPSAASCAVKEEKES